MSDLPIGVRCERDDALRDAQEICNLYGMPCTIRIRFESNVERDAYNSVVDRPTEYREFSVGSFPFNTSPNRRDIEKAGLKEAEEVLAWFASKDFTDRGVPFNDIDVERTTVIAGGESYRMVQKNATGSFLDAFLYYTFALKRI